MEIWVVMRQVYMTGNLLTQQDYIPLIMFKHQD